jgi:thioredoxin-related protein
MKPIKFFISIFFFSFIFISLSCKSKSKITETKKETIQKDAEKLAVNFVDAPLLADILKIAKDQNKWIYMDVGAQWCAPCKLLKKNVYTDKETADIINKNYIPYLVDGEKNEGPDLALIYNIEAYPTLLIIDHKGKIVSKRVGGIGVNALKEFLYEGINLKINQ